MEGAEHIYREARKVVETTEAVRLESYLDLDKPLYLDRRKNGKPRAGPRIRQLTPLRHLVLLGVGNPLITGKGTPTKYAVLHFLWTCSPRWRLNSPARYILWSLRHLRIDWRRCIPAIHDYLEQTMIDMPATRANPREQENADPQAPPPQIDPEHIDHASLEELLLWNPFEGMFWLDGLVDVFCSRWSLTPAQVMQTPYTILWRNLANFNGKGSNPYLRIRTMIMDELTRQRRAAGHKPS